MVDESPKVTPVNTKSAKIKADLKFGEVQRQTLIAEVVVTNIVQEEPPRAVLRFYTKGGTFLGEVPALDILAENQKTF